MDEDPIIVLEGTNGKLELYDSFVRLDRTTFSGVIKFKLLQRKKDIYFEDMSSVEVKESVFPKLGYIRFTGVDRSTLCSAVRFTKTLKNPVKTLLSDNAEYDENAVTFKNKENYKKALQIKEYIEQKIKGDPNVSNVTNVASVTDEIEKLYQLMEKGIITKEEFESKKKKLLEL
jgi:hypothetical protein